MNHETLGAVHTHTHTGNSLLNKIKLVTINLILIITLLVSSLTFATSSGEKIIDITPPRGKIEIVGATQANNTKYVETQEIEVEVSAKDDICSDTEIKYVLSTTPISNTTEIAEEDWNTYKPGEIQKITLQNAEGNNTIYLTLKDATGNTSIAYKGTNVEYKIEYNPNGGTSFTSTVSTKAYYGMPFKTTSRLPTRENYYFIGWSTTPNATTPSYKRGEIVPANVFVGGSKTITLYAVWSQNENGNVLLSDVAEPGDYVDFIVAYNNVNGSEYNGWRVISKNVDLDGNLSPGTVNLVSSGTPLTYYHADNSESSKTALIDNFLETEFSETENYTYRKSGFISNKTLTEIFTNKYVATKADGITPAVRAMKSEDIYNSTELTSMSEEYNMGLNDSKYDNLFANKSIYWLATQKDENNLYEIKEDGYVESNNSKVYGIRPVVQLKAGTIINGMGLQGDWQIKVMEYGITYDANGGNMEEVPVKETKSHDVKYIITDKEPTKENYIFLGWNTNKDATEAEYKAGDEYTTNEDLQLYAIWRSKNAVNVENLGDVELSDTNADLSYNPDTGELGGAVPPPTEPETPEEIPEENLPEIIEFGYGEFEPKTNYTPGTYETVEYETTYTRPKYPVQYKNVVWSKWKITKDAEGTIVSTEAEDIELADIDKQYSTYIVYDFETEEYLETNGVKGDSVELWTIFNEAEDNLENAVYLAAYLNKVDEKTTRHIAKWDGTKYVEYDADTQITEVDTFVETYTVTNSKQVQITAPSSSTEYVYVPLGTLKAEKGMTWAEWLESDYNTTGETKVIIKTSDYEDVLYEDVIEEGKSYGFMVPSEKLMQSRANAPVMDNSLMKAVFWNDDGTIEYESDVFTTDMYDYAMGDGRTDSKEAKWANAKTEDGSYWVWIPRYAYKIIYYTDETKTTETLEKTEYGDIDIIFLKGTSNAEYVDENGVIQVIPDGYKVHPAFQAMTTSEDLSTNPLGKWDEELEGIWIAKYEASKGLSGKVESKPSVQTWSCINIGTMYTESINMYEELNSHMMKNSEWGVAAYLAHSAYGRNGNLVSVNACGDFYTGAGDSFASTEVIQRSYEYNVNSFEKTYSWNTERGKLASTTGNIYGIYDMCGGTKEWVSSYLNNGTENLEEYGAELVNSKDLKTKQLYASGVTDEEQSNIEANGNVYGDAIIEVLNYEAHESWGNGEAFPYLSEPFISRGNTALSALSIPRIFDRDIGHGGYTLGTGSLMYTFRPVLCIKNLTNVNVKKLTYNSNNKFSITTMKLVEASETYILPSNLFETEENKKLIGWNIDGIVYNIGDAITVEKDMTISAVWDDMEVSILGLEESYQYVGTQITPELDIYESGVKLVQNQDYILSYDENLSGEGSVIITFIGNYGGSITKKFIIEQRTDGKHAEFKFGNKESREVTIGAETYVMPNVSANVDKQIGSTIIDGNTIFYPIVNIIMNDGKVSHSAYYYALFPIFNNVVTITDYMNDSESTSIIYDGTTTTLPKNLVVISDMNGVEEVGEIFKYGVEGEGIEEPKIINNILYYVSPETNENKEEYQTVVKWKYIDNLGKVYYYYVGYYAEAQTYSCITPDTLLTLADGTQKRIDEITYEDKLLVWDFEKGKYTTTVPAVLYNHGEANNRVINLTFDDGTILKLIGTHDLFDVEANEFVAINEYNVESYIGHNFVKADIKNPNGYSNTKLVDYTITEEYIGSYSILTAGHLNCITEGVLSRSPAPNVELEDFFDFFKVGEGMKYDEEAMKKDIETYGLYTYEDYKDYVTYEQFIALNGAYYKILVGKGYMTFEDVIEAINMFVPDK